MKKNIANQTFGRLIVLSETGKTSRGTIIWHCKCSCGKEIDVRGDTLRSGNTKSCGCLKMETTRILSTTHGASYSRLYRIWLAMKTRCYNKKATNYGRYGGKGIAVCESWLNDFMIFQKWAMENGYDDTKSIDRKNGNDNYYPENCRWATSVVQQRNLRSNRLLTVKGETKLLCEWAEIYKIHPETISSRIKLGWTSEAAVLTPVRKLEGGKR